MFWGLVLKTNKRYSQQVTRAFHVSQAVLDLGSVNPNDSDAIVQIWLNTDDTDHLLANVSRQTSHVRLDLAFTEGETVSFYSKGHGTVHLSGYLIPDDDDYGEMSFGDEDEEDEEDEESEEEDVQSAPLSKKQKAKALAAANKKQLKVAKDEDEDDDDDDEDDDDDSDDLDLKGLQEELEDEEASDSDSDEDEDEDEDEEEDDSEEEAQAQAPPAKKVKFDKNAKQNGLTNGKVSKKGNDQKQKNQKPEKQEQKQRNQQQQQQQQQQNKQQKPTPKTLPGGVIIQDLRVGSGPEASSGKRVAVYYEGRLKSNNKVFDSTRSGDGFKFRLGAGEVIRGWDIGISGMKVGSKRRITCPSGVAYGAKGYPPSIPGNATLVFDVELRGVY